MSKILIAVDNVFNNDVRVVREAKILNAEGHTVRVLCYSSNEFDTSPLKDITIKRISISKKMVDKIKPLINTAPLFNNLWTRHIKKELIEFKPQFLLTHDLYMAMPSRKAILQSKSEARLILDLHENYPDGILTYNWARGWKSILVQPKKWKKKEGDYLRMADEIVVLSNDYQKKLTSEYPQLRDKFTVFPNVPDLEKFSKFKVKKVEAINLKGPIMFYFGIIGERRGIFDSLESFRRLIKKGIEISYLLVGPVDKTDGELLSAYLYDEQLKNKIQHIEWIKMDELPSYLNAVDFCIAPFRVNPQHESGIANKLFQYMYGKKPIIASNCKPQAELINRAKNGIIFKNEQELDNAIEHMAMNMSELKPMGERGYQELITTYHLDQIKVNFLNIFAN